MTNSREPLVQSFREQAQWCERLGSPFTARLMTRAAVAVEQGGALARLIGDWPGHPGADALPLRLAGALHALVLSGADPALIAVYPPNTAEIETVWHGVEAAMAARPEHFAEYLASPPQTNEVGRSALLLPGFLAIARATGLPLRLLEIGASAGLNQIWDKYRYRFGERCWGDAASPVELVCDWRGAPGPLDRTVSVASRAACDRAPLDIADPAQRARLRAYIWADQSERLARLDGALALALIAGIWVEPADAGDWLDARLEAPAEGIATVVYHSVVWQYLPEATRRRLAARLAAAGAAATPDRPLAHLALEYAGPDYELRLTLWPGGGRESGALLATAHPHGAWLNWRD
ncbi:MAG TPA: DUF2332 family protein [Stellaceae bacterium]|nr:DUF2332 family protein [Stellaceae bacterium]